MSDNSKSWKYFISEKHKAVKPFKLHFLSVCIIVGNIPGIHVVKTF